MRATIFREDFLAAVERVKPAVPSNATIPILAHVLINAAKGELRLRASDCYFEIATTVECDVRENGAVAVSASILARFLKALPENAAVQIECNDDRAALAITAGRCRASLLTLPPDDFPVLPIQEAAVRFALPSHVLHRLLSGTAFAAATEITRPHLAGVYLHAAQAHSATVLRAVATNGHILALADAELPAAAAGLAGVILPAKSVRALVDALKPKDKATEAQDIDVALAVSERLIIATIGPTTYTFRPIDGTYPDYARVVPAGGDKHLSVDRAAFMAALDRVSTAAVHGRALKIDMARGRVQLSSRSLVKGSGYEYEVAGEEEVDAEYAGAPLMIGANGGYLASIVDHMQDAAVTARFDEPGSPILLRVDDANDRLFVLMPMRV